MKKICGVKLNSSAPKAGIGKFIKNEKTRREIVKMLNGFVINPPFSLPIYCYSSTRFKTLAIQTNNLMTY